MKKIFILISFVLVTQFTIGQQQFHANNGTVIPNAAGPTYPTWSATEKSSFCSLSNGNLWLTNDRDTDNDFGRASLGKTSGKYYYEITFTQVDLGWSYYQPIGLSGSDETVFAGHTAGEVDGLTINVNGDTYIRGSIDYGLAGAIVPGDVIGIGLDLDNGLFYVYVNNVLSQTIGSLGAAWKISGHTYYPAAGAYFGQGTTKINFGATAFTYSAPGGFQSGYY